MKHVEITITDEQGSVFASHVLTTRRQQQALRRALQIIEDSNRVLDIDKRVEHKVQELLDDMESACRKAKG